MSRNAASRFDPFARLRRHIGPEVGLERARSRTGAYVYGDILVLAAVVGADHASILHWSALVTVVATTVTTFLAHILAHSIAQQLGRTGEEARLHLRDELRDSVPILSAGIVPAIMMLLGALRVVAPVWAEVVAAVVVISRLALMGVVVEGMTGRKSTLGLVRAGFVLAALSVVIVAIKVLLGH
jgi:hypothetical protein